MNEQTANYIVQWLKRYQVTAVCILSLNPLDWRLWYFILHNYTGRKELSITILFITLEFSWFKLLTEEDLPFSDSSTESDIQSSQQFLNNQL